MKLSDLYAKNIYVGKTLRGACRGVALSLKSYAVKYLLCASASTQSSADFAVNISAVQEIKESISLHRLRPVYPKSCAKLSLGAPVYSFEGGYLGELEDLEMRDFIATRLFTSQGEVYPITAVYACSDAIILRKEQPFPIGQRIPAPILPLFSNKTEAVVTKPILRAAMQKRALIKLTLALPPFNLTQEDGRRRFF